MAAAAAGKHLRPFLAGCQRQQQQQLVCPPEWLHVSKCQYASQQAKSIFSGTSAEKKCEGAGEGAGEGTPEFEPDG